MTPGLPVIHRDDRLLVADPDTGELLPLAAASDRALAAAAEQAQRLDRDLLDCRRALAAELRARHGVGRARAGGYRFEVTQSTSWPARATTDTLARLVADGVIGQADADRCMPARPRPDARQLKALIGRLTVTDPDAARTLAATATVSPPSVRDVQADHVDADTGDPS